MTRMNPQATSLKQYILRWSEKLIGSAAFAKQTLAKQLIIEKYLQNGLEASNDPNQTDQALDNLVWAALEFQITAEQLNNLKTDKAKIKKKQQEGGTKSKYDRHIDGIKKILMQDQPAKVLQREICDLTGLWPATSTISRWKNKYCSKGQ